MSRMSPANSWPPRRDDPLAAETARNQRANTSNCSVGSSEQILVAAMGQNVLGEVFQPGRLGHRTGNDF